MLKNFCIGDSLEYLSVQYAKSGRSSCKSCKQKIGQNQLRIGILVDDDHFSTGQGTQWFHPNCFHFKPRHKSLQSDQLDKKIHNLENINKKDQTDILNYLKADLDLIKKGKPKKEAVHQSKSKPKVQKKQQKKEPQIQKEEPAKRATKSRSQPGKKEESLPKQKTKIQKSKQKIQPVQRNTRSRSQVTKKKQQLPKEKAKKQKKAPVKAKKSAPKTFFTQSQIQEYKKLLNEYSDKGVNQLKQILQKNGQAKTGAKDDLVIKCADGKQLGRIPACSSCGGGKLRFNRQNGTYTCPGYMEDTDFKNCGAKFSYDQVTRLEWVQ